MGKKISLADVQRPGGNTHARNIEELIKAVQGESPRSLAETHALPIEQLKPGRYQPRSLASETDPELTELAASIRALGIIEPIAVRPAEEGDYEILAGERRWRAAQLAGLERVPVIVHPVDDMTAAAIALVENLQRQDLNPLDEASAMHRLLKDFGLSQVQLGKMVGRSKSSISKTVGLLSLAEDVQQLIRHGQLEAGHARLLTNLDARTQLKLARQTVKYGWSVRVLEKHKVALAEDARPESGGSENTADPDIRRLQDRLSEWLSARVKLSLHKGGGGSIEIKFSSADECEGILEKIGFRKLVDV